MRKLKSASFQLTFYFFIFFIAITLLQNILKTRYTYPKVLAAKEKFSDNSIKILKKSIEDTVKKIEVNVVDYSTWDTAYNIFLSDENYLNAFIDDNFVASTFQNLDLDYIGIYTRDNEFIWNGLLDEDELISDREILQIEKFDILNQFKANSELKRMTGIYTFQGSNYIFGVSTITRTDGSGEPLGYFIFAKMIDEEFIETLGYRNNMEIEYIEPTEDNQYLFSKIIGNIDLVDKDYKYYYDNSENHFIYFENIFDEAAFILKLNFYDGISMEDISVTEERYLNTLLAFLIMFTLYQISKKTIVAPLEDLSYHIKRIIYNNKFEEIEQKESTSEVKDLINVFNKLIKLINMQNEQIKNMNKYLIKLAYIDPLTKLYNRRKFEEKYEEFLIRAKKNNKNISLVLCDIDYFKKYNDKYGHILGDKALVEVANIINLSFDNNKEEYVFRYGGEEFLILLYDVSRECTEEKIINIQKEIKKLNIEHNTSKISKQLTLSLGFINFSHDNFESINSAVDIADKALYLAKKNGRNRYEYIEIK